MNRWSDPDWDKKGLGHDGWCDDCGWHMTFTVRTVIADAGFWKKCKDCQSKVDEILQDNRQLALV